MANAPERRTERIDYDGGRWAEIEYLGDERHGRWTVYYGNGQKDWERELEHDRQEGWQRSWSEDGTLLEERGYHLDVPHGPWRYFYPSGAPKSETTFRFGLQHGRSVRWDEAGEVAAEGEYRDGEPWSGSFLMAVWDEEAGDTCEVLRKYEGGRGVEVGDQHPTPESAGWRLLCEYRATELEALTPARTEEILAALRREVTHLDRGASPDLADTAASFLGWVNLGRAGESWPTNGGRALAPLLQISGPDLPLPGLEGLSALAVFVDPEGFPNRIGSDLVVRAYAAGEALCELQAPPSVPRLTEPASLQLQAAPAEVPAPEDLPPALRVALEKAHGEEWRSKFDCHGGSKVGGWPSWIQSSESRRGREFVLQVDTLDFEEWDCGDSSVVYVYRRGEAWDFTLQTC